MAALVKRMDELAPDGAPLIIAGDFNDWRNHADDCLTEQLGVSEVFTTFRGRPARSFPSTLPVLRLDRIYVRGFSVDKAEVHCGTPWSQISDHAPLTAQLRTS
jgi:endonuclease/exonuclease/phosphatase family metal-dependent hydrolase